MTEDILSYLYEARLPDVPEPPLDEDLARLNEGDVVAFARAKGPTVTLRFAAPFEPFLRLDGQRVLQGDSPLERTLLIWLGRHLPFLSRRLEEHSGVRATVVDGEVRLLEVVDLESAALKDHSVTRELAAGGVAVPNFSVLGPVGSRTELMTRLRSLFGEGSTVEVRGEELGRVVWRGRVTVER